MSLHVGERVRSWREIRGIRQLDLAAKAGIDKTRLCKIEKGTVKPWADEVERLAKAMDLTMPEFYGATSAEKAS